MEKQATAKQLENILEDLKKPVATDQNRRAGLADRIHSLLGGDIKKISSLIKKDKNLVKNVVRTSYEKLQSPADLRIFKPATEKQLTRRAIQNQIKPNDTILIANRGEIAIRMMKEAHALGKKVVLIHDGKDTPWINTNHFKPDSGDRGFLVSTYCDRATISRSKRAVKAASSEVRELCTEYLQSFSENSVDTEFLRNLSTKVNDSISKTEGYNSYQRSDITDMESIKKQLMNSGVEQLPAVFAGYGFNSEDAQWMRAVEAMGYPIAGPSSQWLEILGDKIMANERGQDAGLNPPTSSGEIESLGEALRFFNENRKSFSEFLLKDAAGGGGMGQLLLKNPTVEVFKKGVRSFLEAGYRFSIDEWLEGCRHIEFQVAVDMDGSIVFFGERDCTEQIQMQKVIEEVALGLNQTEVYQFRQSIAKFFNNIKQETGQSYLGMATVETLYVPSAPEGKRFRFLEVNTRPQVEIGVTEGQSGFNLIQTILLLSEGYKLIPQDIIDKENFGGHTMEARLTLQSVMPETMIEYYEKQGTNKMLITNQGRLNNLQVPEMEHVWIDYDERLIPGCTTSMDYDPLIAKILVHKDSLPDEGIEQTRERTIRALTDAVENFIVSGIDSNREIIKKIINHRNFIDRLDETTGLANENKAAALIVAQIRAENIKFDIQPTIVTKNPLQKILLELDLPFESALKECFHRLSFADIWTLNIEANADESTPLPRNLGFAKKILPLKKIIKKFRSIKTAIFPESFAYLEQVLVSLGFEPFKIIKCFNNKKELALKMRQDDMLFDTSYLYELLSTLKGKKHLESMAQLSMYNDNNIHFYTKSLPQRDAPVQESLNRLLKVDCLSMIEHPNSLIIINKGVLPLYKQIFELRLGHRFDDYFFPVHESLTDQQTADGSHQETALLFPDNAI